MAIQQGDKYSIGLIIKHGDTEVIPSMVSGIKLQLGDTEYVYPNGTLTYSNSLWKFPVTQAQTLACIGKVPIQIQVKYLSGDIYGTEPDDIDVKKSIIDEEWS